MADERIQRVTMPKWGLSMTSGTVTDWVAAEGEEVAKGADLAEIDTDKIVGTLEAAGDGVLRRVVVAAGSAAPVGATIAVIAPPEVPDAEVDAVVDAERARLAAGAAEAEQGPAAADVAVGGRSVAYASLGAGDGDPVLLVHGFGGDKNSWLFVQEPLAADRRVIAVDLPGHGASGKDVGGGSLDELAAVLTGFLDAMGIERAHVVGHSLGGAVAVAAAARAPERVRSLTLVAPAGVGTQINADFLRGFAAADTRKGLKPHLASLFADSAQVNRRLVDDLLRYKRIDGVRQALDTLLGTLLDGDGPALDIAPLIAGVGVPVAAVWGAQDAVLPVGNADALPPSVRTRRVAGAGHMAHMEAPAEVRAAVEEAIAAAG
ncbi:pyruvate dehydrogenase E2 component (dihydrolipoamide acetyltransferase) [Murinocardiopsis flavida]|uniref:Pyruvate dehydrogenase E2 component (Dihydrolipoamide acetyltransferase) n=1 Tax=Murinocardiopsis flavida TaxID=645275 RepID=A0A2P8DMQ1_9ACTN|nr:acetoin dehydrogenase dihydrolipoyllysine-residue acetyltransferase subunit [Murinocardiopsis flavida]PSK98485.1 pyruvate dehydrogenase E2 component (dihydrolipoamide acetyltransferase) [Murinocardiopsis flavida]